MFCFFFFSSRRRHTRSLCDWSSDVCSSDLRRTSCRARAGCRRASTTPTRSARSRSAAGSEERRVGKSVDLGGRRIIKKKKKKDNNYQKTTKTLHKTTQTIQNK